VAPGEQPPVSKVGISLASPLVYPVMVIVSATLPVCPGLVSVYAGLFVP
jgi:hypothetical protein